MEYTEHIKILVQNAREAQREVDNYTQEQIDDVCRAIAWEVYNNDNVEKLARSAVIETGMGVYEDKVSKHKNKVLGVLKDVLEGKSVGLIEKDEIKGISKYAKPIGVIGALTPVTNPTATPASNAVSIIKGRNAVIFAPHPRSNQSTKMAVEMMRSGLKKVGAPQNLIQVLEEPSIDLTGELMKQVDLVVATGGGAMVKAAYSSGTPAYGVGPGNSCQIIAEDADIEDAATKIASSKTFDNATSCSSENSIIIHESIYLPMLEKLKNKNAYICSYAEKQQLMSFMWVIDKHGHQGLNPKVVGQSALKIAESSGLKVPPGTKMLIVEGEMPLEQDLFSSEKLSPVLTVWKYKEFTEGFDILKRLTDHSGTGHSCGIHTYKKEYIEYLGQNMKTSRIMARQPQAAANGGAFFNGMPSTVTMGCGTWGGNITSENINYKHFINVTWVSEPIEPHRPTDDEIWGDFFKKYGYEVNR